MTLTISITALVLALVSIVLTVISRRDLLEYIGQISILVMKLFVDRKENRTDD